MVAFLNARPKIPMVTFLSNISFTHNMLANESRMGYQQAQSPYLSALDFCNLKYWVWWTGFLGGRNIQFIKFDFSNWRIAKINFSLEYSKKCLKTLENVFSWIHQFCQPSEPQFCKIYLCSWKEIALFRALT